MLHLYTIFNCCLNALSEGSVIAYYVSEFSVPAGQEASVDSAMSSMEKLVDKERRTMSRPGNSLAFDDITNSGRVKATVHNLSCCFARGLLWNVKFCLFCCQHPHLKLFVLCFISQHLIPAWFEHHTAVSAQLASMYL